MNIKIYHTDYLEVENDIINFRNSNRSDFKNQKYFRWRYLERPSDYPPVVVIAECKDNIIGAMSIIPHKFFINNDIVHFGVIGDISVNRNFRRKGIATSMFKYINTIKELNYLYSCIVLPNKEASYPLKKANWSQVDALYRFVKIINISTISTHATIKFLLNRINYFYKLINIIKLKVDKSYNYYIADSIKNDLVDKIWQESSKNNTILSIRNSEYLKWRFENHPFLKFHFFYLTFKKEPIAYLVFLFDEGIIKIVDFLCKDSFQNLILLFKAFILYVFKKDLCEKVYIRINNISANYILFKKAGFIKRKDFQPVFINQLNKAFKNYNWFLTSSDKDV